MARLIDLSVAVNSNTMSPSSTKIKGTEGARLAFSLSD